MHRCLHEFITNIANNSPEASVTGVLTVTDCVCWSLQYLLWYLGSACVKLNSTTANVKEKMV